MSVWMQTLHSLRGLEWSSGVCYHRLVVVSQVPATWHWSEAVQTTGLEPIQAPAWQVSVWVQALPSLQALPFGLGVVRAWRRAGAQISAVGVWLEAGQMTGLEPTQGPAW